MPGGVFGAVLTVMILMFLLGFVLDFIEITFVVVLIVGPIVEYLRRRQERNYRDQLYWYGTVETNDARYHVAVYAAVRTDREHSAASLGEGLSLIHLDIVEEADFRFRFQGPVVDVSVDEPPATLIP